MKEISAHFLLVFAGLGILSIIAFAIAVTRRIDDKDGGFDPSLKTDGKTIDIAGKTYGLHRVEATLGSPHFFLSLPVGAPHTFSVQREDGLEKLIAHLGAMSKVSTGNSHYDDEFEIRSKDEAWAKAFFADEEHRRLVQALFGLDAATVILSGDRVSACFEEKSALAEGGPALSELAEALPAA